MKLVLSGLNSLVVGGCSAALLLFLGVNLDKRPWWSWHDSLIIFAASVVLDFICVVTDFVQDIQAFSECCIDVAEFVSDEDYGHEQNGSKNNQNIKHSQPPLTSLMDVSRPRRLGRDSTIPRCKFWSGVQCPVFANCMVPSLGLYEYFVIYITHVAHRFDYLELVEHS